jgi:L-amino acid N-acyltransferase YncA
MDNNFQIRKATYNDLPDIARIHVMSWQQTYVGQVPKEYLDSLNVEDRRRKWQESFDTENSKHSHLYVAHRNGVAVGFVSFGRGRDNDKADWGEIYAIYLLQEAWGKGIGHALFKIATKKLNEEGYKKLYIWVLNTNSNAIDAYLKWGGILIKTCVKNLEIGGKAVKEIIVQFA